MFKNKKIYISLLMVLFIVIGINIYSSISSSDSVLDGNVKINNSIKDENIKLDGKWNYIPNRLVTYDEIIENKYNPIKVNIPMAWSDRLNDKKGTFYLKVESSKNYNQNLGLYIQRIYSNYKLYVNDHLYYSSAFNKKRSLKKYNFLSFNSKSKDFYIILQTDNFFYNSPGIRESIYLGNNQNINEFIQFNNNNSLVLTGAFIILFLITLVILKLNKNKRNLWFFAYSIILIIRFIFIKDNLIFSSINTDIVIKLEYVSATSLGFVFLNLYNHIYNEKFNKSIFKKINYYLIIITTLFLIIPIDLYIIYANIILLLSIILVISFILYSILTLKNPKIIDINQINNLVVLSSFIIALFAIHDILKVHYNIAFINLNLTPYSFIIISILIIYIILKETIDYTIVKERNKKLYTLLDNTPLGILEVDFNSDEIRFINEKLEKDYKLDNTKLKEIKINHFFNEQFWSFLKNKLKDDNHIKGYQLELDKKVYQVSLKLMSQTDDEKIIVLFDDVTEKNAYSQQLDEVMNNLEQKVKKRTKTLQKFKDMVLEVNKISNIAQYSEEELLAKIFNIAIKVIDKADCGSIYYYKDGLVCFIESKGHNIEPINKLQLNKNDLRIPKNEVEVYNNLSSKTDPNFTDKQKKIFLDNVVPTKETLIKGIFFNNELVGALTVEISKSKGLSFTKNDIELFDIYTNLISSYYNNFKNHKLKENFLKAEKENLKKELNIDNLTGLYNKKYFLNKLKQFWNESIINSKPISVIMIDIDDFKNYNDKYGHLEGDKALKKVSNTLKKSARRSNDIIARYGGEEFIVLFPNTSNKDAKKLAEQMRISIKKLKIINEVNEDKNILTISLGVATIFPLFADKIDDFINEADKQLYKSKNNGRNQVNSIKIKHN